MGRLRAQRLAASMESSHAYRQRAWSAPWCSTPCGINGILTGGACAKQGINNGCSTPCGINGILTPLGAIREPAVVVLNALRHQWNPHVWQKTEGASRGGAQRLAASMESSPVAPSITSYSQCAQRLAASMESSRYPPKAEGSALMVLNALRHQWNPHSMGSNLLVYKNLWVALRDTQRLATLTESSHAERVACYSIKALKTNVLADTHAPRLGL